DDAPDAPTIASGHADGPMYGYVAGDGTSSTPTFDRRASLAGKPGGRGDSTDPGAVVGPDRTRPAHVIGGYANDGDFPKEAGEIAPSAKDRSRSPGLTRGSVMRRCHGLLLWCVMSASCSTSAPLSSSSLGEGTAAPLRFASHAPYASVVLAGAPHVRQEPDF